ncbi:MAG: hypothetical protein M3252_03780, partial [Actinomycetota bacterium]|nr:hypothetical protein [Actinomycetota bacterium]
LAQSMGSDENVRELAELGATAGYEVTHTQKTPILSVTARGSSKELVLHTAELVLQRLQDDLATRQQEAGAPALTLIRSQVLSPPRTSMHAGNRPRVMAAVGAVGVGLTTLLAFAVESLAAWRSRRHQLPPPPLSGGPLFDYSHAAPEPPSHFGAEREPAEPPVGNGWHRDPPSGPLVDVVVGTPGRPPEDPIEAQPFDVQGSYEARPFEAEDFPGATFEEGPPENEVPAPNENLEQQDGLVDAWWSAWERRQAGRREVEDPMSATTYLPAEDWAGDAAAAGSKDMATSSRPDVLDDAAGTNPSLDEHLGDDDHQVEAMVGGDPAESLLAWGGRVEVLGGTAHVEPPSRPFLPRADRNGVADQPDA